MSHGIEHPLQHPEVQAANGRSYVFGFLVSIVLMTLSLGLVTDHTLSPLGLMIAVSAIALVAVTIQSVLLLHLDLSKTQIWNTVALVLMIPLFILTIALTIWMFQTLYERTMLPGMMMH